MSSSKRASLSNNSPLDQLFGPAPRQDEGSREQEVTETATPAEPAPTRDRAEAAARAPLVAEEAPATLQDEAEERELRQTTIMIYGDQSDWLDEACYLARRESGTNISKAAILRALVDMAREEEDVRGRLRERLGIGR